MTPRLKLGAYGLLLAAMVGGGAALGATAGPIDVGGGRTHDIEPAHDTSDEDTTMISDLPAGGLLVAQDGYRFEPEDRLADAGRFAFAITGPDGHPVGSYELLHDRELHLIVASRDLQHYAHLHPEREADGHWSVTLPPLPAGAYRAFADFRPTGDRQYTLGVDLTVPGATAAPVALRPRSTDTVDGFEVTLEPEPIGEGTEVSVTVRRGGDIVATEPYLGAAGHLVALRDGDLAYLHVHPLEGGPAGPVRFAVEVPTAGTYALFFDFQVDGQVHTASFVIDAPAPRAAAHGGHSDH